LAGDTIGTSLSIMVRVKVPNAPIATPAGLVMVSSRLSSSSSRSSSTIGMDTGFGVPSPAAQETVVGMAPTSSGLAGSKVGMICTLTGSSGAREMVTDRFAAPPASLTDIDGDANSTTGRFLTRSTSSTAIQPEAWKWLIWILAVAAFAGVFRGTEC
jgi:hypothetical protein